MVLFESVVLENLSQVQSLTPDTMVYTDTFGFREVAVKIDDSLWANSAGEYITDREVLEWFVLKEVGLHESLD